MGHLQGFNCRGGFQELWPEGPDEAATKRNYWWTSPVIQTIKNDEGGLWGLAIPGITPKAAEM